MADVLKATMRVRTWLTKNELTVVDHEYHQADRVFTHHAHQRSHLPPFEECECVTTCDCTPGDECVCVTGCVCEPWVTMELGSVLPVYGLGITTDRTIVVAINGTHNQFNLVDNGVFFMTGSITSVFLRNNNTTYTATVEMLAFGED